VVRPRPGLSLGFLICSWELVSQGSGAGGAGAKGLVLWVRNEPKPPARLGSRQPSWESPCIACRFPQGSAGSSSACCLPCSASSHGPKLAELATHCCPTCDSGGICGGGICLAI